jgi:serine phosphatase RsbU (regulator of sigma subunit)
VILNITDCSQEPVADQIVRQLLVRIMSGEYAAGRQLAPAGAMARRQQVSVKSVRRAYRELERSGLIERRENGGCVVAALSDDERFALGKRRRLYGEAMEQLRIEEEMGMARQIQADLFPASLPYNDELQVAAWWKPSRKLGGDFYDVFAVDESRWALVIGDASGKGLPAALMIARVQAMVRCEIENGNSITAALRKINRRLAVSSSPDNFVTVCCCIYDRRTRAFQYANAGHNPPFIVRNAGGNEPLESTGPLLGVMHEATYETGIAWLNPGDTVFLYTDGVTETMHGSDEYGEQRLRSTLERARGVDVEATIDVVLDDLEVFGEAQDDRTIVVLRAADGERDSA